MNGNSSHLLLCGHFQAHTGLAVGSAEAEELASLVAQVVKNLPARQETQVQPLGHKDPLQEQMATHFSILAWEIPWTEEPGGLQSMGVTRVGHDLATNKQKNMTRQRL